MNAVRDFIQANPSAWLLIGGLMVGIAFGTLVMRTNFCTMGAISDAVTFNDYRRFRAWVLAAATALIGAQMLDAYGIVALSKSSYLNPRLNWFGNIAGGLMFGFGMVFAGGCASRNLVRVGVGDLRSLMTLMVMGLFAYMTIGGILGPARDWIEQATSLPLGRWSLSTQSIGELTGSLAHLGPDRGNALTAAAVAAAMVLYCFKDASFRTSWNHILSGFGIGLCVVAGWALTGLAFDDLAERPTTPLSLTFVRPTADALEWLQRFTAGMVPGFSVATVFGTVLGSFATATAMGRFKLTTFTGVADTQRALFGAAFMGIGGVLALGCTIGQAITGLSTLAAGSFLTFAAIIVGAVGGLKKLESLLTAEG